MPARVPFHPSSQASGKCFSNIHGYVTAPNISTDIARSVGALYLYSGDSIRKHSANSLETALGEQKSSFLSQCAQ